MMIPVTRFMTVVAKLERILVKLLMIEPNTVEMIPVTSVEAVKFRRYSDSSVFLNVAFL